MDTINNIFLKFRNNQKSGIVIVNRLSNDIFISYHDLYTKAIKVKEIIKTKGVQKGDELIFQINDYPNFLITFWACVISGVLPVPINVNNTSENIKKIKNVKALLNNAHLITEKKLFSKMNQIDNKVFTDKIIYTDDFNNENIEENTDLFQREPEDLVYLQFSSGTTGDPKGICLNSINLLANINDIVNHSNITEKDKLISWMPLTHDMGLIGVHLLGCLMQIDQILMAPSVFIREPELWLCKTDEYKASVLYSPNFGYKHFLKYLNKDKHNWDLSHINVIFNGAEPISYNLCMQFLNELEYFGLPKKSMRAVYGLAEASLAVSIPTKEAPLKYHSVDRRFLNIGDKVQFIEDNKQAFKIVEEGYPVSNCEVIIVDNEWNKLEEEHIGHICIKGKNVTSGYYNNQKKFNEIYKNGWLKTGDLGFLKNKKLSITGRYKDIIFVNGINYYSNDLEEVILKNEAIDSNEIAVVGVFNENKRRDDILVFIKEKGKISDKFLKKLNKIRTLLHSKVGIPIAKTIPINSLPKTSSGKIERYKLRQNYLAGDLEKTLTEIEDLIELNTFKRLIESELIEILEQSLEIRPIRLSDDLFSLGAESVNVVSSINEIELRYDIKLPIEEVLDDPVIEVIAKKVTNKFYKEYIKFSENLQNI